MSSILRASKPCASCLRRLRATQSISSSTSSTPIIKQGIALQPSTPHRRYASTTQSSTGSGGFGSTSYSKAKASNGDASSAKKRIVDMSEFPPERIRNLSIIAHIDHGKSTLADRLLQMTGTVPPSSSPQFLDKLKVERERGITVKAQTVSIVHRHTDGHKYLINLIDTPGHVDFSYEVSRSLGACEGGLLLVDCAQGIQAQTLSVFHHAADANLKLLAVINKVDLPHASPEETSEEIETSLGIPEADHMRISAKSGLGVENVLSNIIEGLPPPKQRESDDGKLRGLIFDTFYDQFRGVVSLVRVFSGTVKKGDKVRFLQAGRKYEILEVGINNPDEVPVEELKDGQVGYVVCNMKNSEEAFIGDTLCWADKPVEPLPGFKPMKAMVYAGIFPMDSSDFPKLEESIERLTLNDRSVSVQRESSAALSQGFRLGFLGTLHMDVFKQRLEDEYSSEVIVTAPTVPYKVVYLNDTEVYVSNPVDFPEVGDQKLRIGHIEEPMINATIFVPNEYIGEMMDLCARYRGVQQEYRILENSDRAILRYQLPLAEIVTDFFSELKSASSGFASFDYEEAGYEKSNLVKLNILINGKPVDALAMIVHKFAAQSIGKAWVKKLKEVVPRQQFELSIQAAIGAKVIARENVSAFRKDVTAGLYGGHYDRKLKHLNKQKEGKKRLKRLAGNIDIPQTAFYQVLSSRPRAFTTSARNSLSSDTATVTPPFPKVLSISSDPNEDTTDESVPASSSIPVAEAAATATASSSASPDSPPRQDPVSPHVPSTIPELEPLPAQAAELITPISRHTFPPPERAIKLSAISRMTSIPPPPDVTAARLSEAYEDLYQSSPNSHMFTTSEVHEIVTALRALQAREGGDRRSDFEQLSPLITELKELVGNDSKAVRGLELAILSSTSMVNRVPKTTDIKRIEATFRKLFRTAPPIDDIKSRDKYRASINHLMYLCALAEHETRVDDWWDKLAREGFEHDSYSYLAKMVLCAKLDRTDEILPILHQAFAGQMSTQDQGVLVNFAIHAYARLGRWDVVVPAYSKMLGLEDKTDIDSLLPDSNYGYNSSSNPSTPSLPVPDGVKATVQTFGPLISAYADHGHFPASLTVLKHIFEFGDTPSIKDYVSLFRGFSLYGEIPPSNSSFKGGKRGTVEGLGEMGKVFGVEAKLPASIRIHGESKSEERVTSSSERSASGSGRKRESFEERLTDIWERGNMFAEPPSKAYPSSSRSAGVTGTGREADERPGWTFEALEDVFESFLTLRPAQTYQSASSLSGRHETHPHSTVDSKSDSTAAGGRSSNDVDNQGSTSVQVEAASASAQEIIPRASSNPNGVGTKGPNRKALWIILRAYTRLSGGEREIIQRAWEGMEDKFGPGNEQGWVGWKVDNRLVWAREVLYKRD